MTTTHRTLSALAAAALIVVTGVAGCTPSPPVGDGAAQSDGSGQSDSSTRTSVGSAPSVPRRGSTQVASAPASSPIPLVRPGQPGLVVGHRGNAAGAPEDTLASMVSAAGVGAQVLEFDLHMPADGVPVVMHDDTVDRTTDGTGRISSMTLAQIEQLDAGSTFSPAFAGIRVPTFEQILKFAASTDLIILPELKEDTWSADQIQTVADLIHQYQMAGRTMFQSFFPDMLQLVHQVAPRIARAGLVTTVPSDPVGFVRNFAGQGLLPEASGVTSELVTTLHQAGLSIMPWTVDDPGTWATLTADGVDGIMSNNPGALSGWIERYRQRN